MTEIAVPRAAAEAGILDPHRYKVLSGGRGAGKSWLLAALALVEGLKSPGTILCAREVQNTIMDSVHALLRHRIETLGLRSAYTVTDREIRSRSGTTIIFRGLRTNVEEIKSMEGVRICWVAQADQVSYRSWEVLIPTIRDAGSEIWIDFNPRYLTDATYDLFVTHRMPDEIYAHLTYRDNPFFPAALDAERRHLLEVDRAKHDHVYEGTPLTYADALVYTPSARNLLRDGDLRAWLASVPGESLRIAGGLDFGFEDADALALVLWSTLADHPERWLIGEYKERRQSVSAFAQAIRLVLADVARSAPRVRIDLCADFGGGGKQIAWELYTQHGIPCWEGAAKGDRLLGVDMLRDELSSGAFRLREDGPTWDEMRHTVWQRDERERIVRQIDDSAYHPDALWAVIYAMRQVWSREPSSVEIPMVPSQQERVMAALGMPEAQAGDLASSRRLRHGD